MLRCLDVTATTRAAFYLYNTEDEVDRLAGALSRVEQLFESASPVAGAG